MSTTTEVSIWTIARRELVELRRNGIVWAAGIITLLLLVTALATGWSRASALQQERNLAAQVTREHWLGQGQKNPHSAAHYGIYAFKPVSTLSFIDEGVDRYAGTLAWLEAHKQNPFLYPPARDESALERFGSLTPSMVLQAIVPLLLILLGYACIAGERETGTLRQVLSLGVTPGRLLRGKALALSVITAILLAPAVLIGAIVLLGPESADPARTALITIGYLGYFALWIGATVLVSAVARTGRQALVVLLLFWVANAVVGHRLASDLVRWAKPTPSALAFQTDIQTDISRGGDGHTPRTEREAAVTRAVLARYNVDSVSQLPVSLAGIQLQEGEVFGNAIFDKHWGGLAQIHRSQDQIRAAIGLLLPGLAMRSLSTAAAGTDAAHHRHFAGAAEGYRREFVEVMNNDMRDHAVGQDFGYMADSAVWAAVKPFTYAAPSVGWAMREAALPIGMLLLWLVLVSVLLTLTARRLQPA